MKYRRSPRRDRTAKPHSRIPDSIYFEVLPYITPPETKLWLALKSREWRKDGSRRGIVKKSLNRIAKDIRMNRKTVQRAFRGLRQKGLAEWAGFGIRLIEPSFTTPVTTGVTTGGSVAGGPKTRQGWRHSGAGSDVIGGPATTVIPFPPKESGCGRSDLTIRRARDEPARAVEVPNASADTASRKSARASARSSRALSINAGSSGKNGGDVMKLRPEDTCGARAADELKVEKMGWAETKDLLERIKKRGLEEAEKGSAEFQKREADERRRVFEERQEKRRREIERRALLQKQRELLAAAEPDEDKEQDS